MVMNDFELFRQTAALLRLETPAIVSWLQLAKRICQPDDQIRRAVFRLERQIGSPLIKTENRRLRLTETGGRLSDISQLLSDLRLSGRDAESPEGIVIEIPPVLDAVPLLRAAADFLRTWPEAVALRWRFSSETTAHNIAMGSTAFAIVAAEDCENKQVEWLETEHTWRLELPKLRESHPTDASENATPSPLFVPEGFPKLATLLSKQHPTMVECPSHALIQLAVEQGLGTGCLLHRGTPPASSESTSLPPVHLGLVPPRRKDKASEAVRQLFSDCRETLMASPSSEANPRQPPEPTAAATRTGVAVPPARSRTKEPS